MGETTLPKLRVIEEEARQKIEVRIEEGQQLLWPSDKFRR